MADTSPLTEQQLGERRTRLEERARALVAQLHEVAEDLPGAPHLSETTVEDDAEHGEKRTRAAVRGAEQDRDAAELREITAALTRMDEGRYGICVDCGTDIPLARLTVQPAATRCVACQQRYEAKHPNEVRAVLAG
jgi:DnaK suppressor protein